MLSAPAASLASSALGRAVRPGQALLRRGHLAALPRSAAAHSQPPAPPSGAPARPPAPPPPGPPPSTWAPRPPGDPPSTWAPKQQWPSRHAGGAGGWAAGGGHRPQWGAGAPGGQRFQGKPGGGGARAPQPNPISDSSKVGFGKHSEKTYAALVAEEGRYCDWIVDELFKSDKPSEKVLRLVAYIQRRRLEQRPAASARPPEPPGVASAREEAAKAAKAAWSALPQEVCGPAGCLNGKTFALTGSHQSGLPRTTVEALIGFFGGEVRGSVSGKTSFVLVLSEELKDEWRPPPGGVPRSVRTSRKHHEAEARGVPLLEGLDGLLEIVRGDTGKGKKQCFKIRGP